MWTWMCGTAWLTAELQDKYVDCARTYLGRLTRGTARAGLHALIKAVHGEAVRPWILEEALYRASTIRRWESERRAEFTSGCYGTLPERKPLPSGSRGAPELQHYRFRNHSSAIRSLRICGGLCPRKEIKEDLDRP